MADFICPYEEEYNKLTDEQKELVSAPCKSSVCVLNPSICRERLLKAYDWSKENN